MTRTGNSAKNLENGLIFFNCKIYGVCPLLAFFQGGVRSESYFGQFGLGVVDQPIAARCSQ